MANALLRAASPLLATLGSGAGDQGVRKSADTARKRAPHLPRTRKFFAACEESE